MWCLLLLERLRASSVTCWGASTGTAEQLRAGWVSLSIHQSYVAGLVSSQHGSLRVTDLLHSLWLLSGKKQKEPVLLKAQGEPTTGSVHFHQSISHGQARLKGRDTDSISWCEDWDIQVGHWDWLSCMWYKVQIVQGGTPCEVFLTSLSLRHQKQLLLCFLSILPEIVCT